MGFKKLFALFVIWHQHANALIIADMLAPMHEVTYFEEMACAKVG